MRPKLHSIRAAILVFLLCVGSCRRGSVPSASPHDEVRRAVQAAAHSLSESVTETGMFVYRINLDPAVYVANRYNILRHAGAVYAMAMYDGTWPDEKVRSAMLRAGRYLRDEGLDPVPEDGNMMAVWSRPEVNPRGEPLQAKLGGAGLGLVALLSIDAIQPGFTPIEQLRGLGRFIVYMQKPAGNFYSKYIPAAGGRLDLWESLYYPGEAALGLVMLYEKDSDPLWLESAVKTLIFLAESRQGKASVPLDHWALLATERLFALQPSMVQDEVRQLLTDHAAQICASMMDRYEDGANPGDEEGLFARKLSVTQVSCTLEGILAARTFFPSDHSLRPRIDSVAKDGITFLLGVQVDDGKYQGAFPRMAPVAAGQDQAHPDPRATEIRIDYTQHAISALIRYSQRFPAEEK